MSTSPSPAPEGFILSPGHPPTPQRERGDRPPEGWTLPVETDIYILPDGRVVIADLPAELVEATIRIGYTEPCEIGDHEPIDSAA